MFSLLFPWLKKQARTPQARRQPARTRPTFRPSLEALEVRCVPSATVLNVTSNLDDGSAGTLRFEVAAANLLTGGATINFSPHLGNSIKLDPTKGELLLKQTVTLQGPSSSSLVTIDAGGNSRVFEVAPGASVTLINLNLIDGDGVAQACNSVWTDGLGGAILNEGYLSVQDCTLSCNSASYEGGAIYNASPGEFGSSTSGHDGTLIITKSSNGGYSTLSYNYAEYGGAIYNAGGYGGSAGPGAMLTIVSNSTLSYNSAYEGGAIFNAAGASSESPPQTINSATGAVSTGGGSITGGGIVTIDSSTVSNNCAYAGGAIFNASSGVVGVSRGSAGLQGGTIRVYGVTITDGSFLNNNTAEFGGAILNTGSGGGGGGSGLSPTTSFFGGGTVSISASTLDLNNAYVYGGAIDNDFGTVTITGSTLDSNQAGYLGGAIFNSCSASVTISSSTLEFNSAYEAGGGVFNAGLLTVNQASNIYDNLAPYGTDVENIGTFHKSADSLVVYVNN